MLAPDAHLGPAREENLRLAPITAREVLVLAPILSRQIDERA